QITAAADVAKGTFFNYFPTKTHVLLDYHARIAAEGLGAGERLRGTCARGLFGAFFRKMAALARREGAAFDLLLRQVVAQPGLSAADESVAPRTIALYSRFLRAGIDSGELRPG